MFLPNDNNRDQSDLHKVFWLFRDMILCFYRNKIAEGYYMQRCKWESKYSMSSVLECGENSSLESSQMTLRHIFLGQKGTRRFNNRWTLPGTGFVCTSQRIQYFQIDFLDNKHYNKPSIITMSFTTKRNTEANTSIIFVWDIGLNQTKYTNGSLNCTTQVTTGGRNKMSCNFLRAMQFFNQVHGLYFNLFYGRHATNS